MHVVVRIPAGAYMPLFDASMFVGKPVNEDRTGRRIGTITGAEMRENGIHVTMRVRGNSVYAEEVRGGRMPDVVEWSDDSNYSETS